jgi:hypothetical protein
LQQTVLANRYYYLTNDQHQNNSCPRVSLNASEDEILASATNTSLHDTLVNNLVIITNEQGIEHMYGYI